MANTKLKVSQLQATTSVGSPGVDTLLPTEKAVRDAIGAAASPALIQLAVLTPTGTSADFTSISGGYSSLRVIFVARTDRSGQVFEGIDLKFNNDAGNNYDTIQWDGNNPGSPTFGATEAFAGAQAPCATTTGDSATASVASSGELTFPHYAATTFHKTFFSLGGVKYGVSAGNMHNWGYSGVWRATTAVSRITFVTRNGSNFVTGTTFTLYGIL
jgi:hypothetical protein